MLLQKWHRCFAFSEVVREDMAVVRLAVRTQFGLGVCSATALPHLENSCWRAIAVRE